MKDEALRLALEALKTCRIDGDGWSGPHYDFDDVKVGKAIIAIRQALEQPVATNDTSQDRVDETAKQRHEPEPVAWMYESVCGKDFATRCDPPSYAKNIRPLYTSLPKPEPLTDVQIATLYWGVTGQSLRPQDNALAHKFARAIEAAHGIKGDA